MSRLDSAPSADVSVRVGDCECVGHPHDEGDMVWLKPAVDLDLGLASNAAIRNALGDTISMEKALGVAYIRYGITRWNFLDDEGQEIPLTPDNAERALPWAHGGSIVANKADELYSEAVIRPLLAAQPKRSARGPTATSTSPTPIKPSGNRRRSARSSSPASAGTAA